MEAKKKWYNSKWFFQYPTVFLILVAINFATLFALKDYAWIWWLGYAFCWVLLGIQLYGNRLSKRDKLCRKDCCEGWD
jgi:hypothetical protein